MADNGFTRVTSGSINTFRCRALDEVNGLHHAFSTRRGGTSSDGARSLNLGYVPWDLREQVDENRRRFLNAAGMEDALLITVSQTHSDELHIIREKPRQWNQRPRADALATRLDGLALAVQVADCFPILIADPKTDVVAAVHSGWRGTLARILSKTVSSLGR